MDGGAAERPPAPARSATARPAGGGVEERVDRGIRAMRQGLLVNTALALIKLVAGLLGNSYALVADAVESAGDVVSSLVVWGGLRVAGRDPDEQYPFGYGKAEPLAGAVVGLMLVGAAIGIAIEAVAEIRTPHHAPAPWTLLVLVLVVLAKLLLSRRVEVVGDRIGSAAVRADARHHLSDALTSGAAFVGISIALLGGPGWEQADDWAALVAAAVIVWNGFAVLRPALDDLMDRRPGDSVVAEIRRVAESVPGVLATEKIAVRRSGLALRVTLHVQAAANTPLDEAHAIGGRVKAAIRAALSEVQSVLVHMEPWQGEGGG
jgi:cation diffusion facilitator family transporter